MTIHLLYREKFDPIVRIGEYVGILDGTRQLGIYQVTYIEPIQPIVINLGPLSAPASIAEYPKPGNDKTLSEIDLGERELGQFRIKLLDDFMLEVYQPASTTRFNLRNGPTRVSILSPGNFVELFTISDERKIKVKPYNIRFEPMQLARIMIYGFRYVLKEVKERVREVTWVIVGAKAPTTA